MIMPLELEEARRDVIIVSSPAGPIFSSCCPAAPQPSHMWVWSNVSEDVFLWLIATET